MFSCISEEMQRQMLVRFGVIFVIVSIQLDYVNAAMTMKQLEQSLAMFKKTCLEKTNIPLAMAEGMHNGEFPEDKTLKCYTMCIAQSSGVLTKKNEISEKKIKQQIETILPEHLRQMARDALGMCKDIQYSYKDPCDKSFYSTKCMYDFSPKDFLYP